MNTHSLSLTLTDCGGTVAVGVVLDGVPQSHNVPADQVVIACEEIANNAVRTLANRISAERKHAASSR